MGKGKHRDGHKKGGDEMGASGEGVREEQKKREEPIPDQEAGDPAREHKKKKKKKERREEEAKLEAQDSMGGRDRFPQENPPSAVKGGEHQLVLGQGDLTLENQPVKSPEKRNRIKWGDGEDEGALEKDDDGVIEKEERPKKKKRRKSKGGEEEGGEEGGEGELVPFLEAPLEGGFGGAMDMMLDFQGDDLIEPPADMGALKLLGGLEVGDEKVGRIGSAEKKKKKKGETKVGDEVKGGKGGSGDKEGGGNGAEKKGGANGADKKGRGNGVEKKEGAKTKGEKKVAEGKERAGNETGLMEEPKGKSLYDKWGAHFDGLWQTFWNPPTAPGAASPSGKQNGVGGGAAKKVVKAEPDMGPGSDGQAGEETGGKRKKKAKTAPAAANGGGNGVAGPNGGANGAAEAPPPQQNGQPGPYVIRGPLLCKEPGCEKPARWGHKQGKLPLVPDRCSQHKEEGMAEKKNPLCEVQHCTAVAVWHNSDAKGKARCSNHKEPGMVK